MSDEELEERVISIVSTYGSSKQLCLTIPTRDLSIMGKSFKACFVQIEILDLVDLLAFDDQGRTYFGLYSKNGKNLSGTELGPFVSTQDIFEAVKGTLPDNVWEVNRDHFAKGIGGSMTFTANGIEETLSYVPVEGTDWEMAVLIRENVIRDQIKDISEQGLSTSRKQILFTLVSALLLAAVLMFELGQLSKDRLEEEKEASRTFRNMASTDSMTGVRNKHAYFESETLINKQIREKVISGLAVVVCDINGLKYVNDTQGHAAGDRLIKDACALICEYFTHGAVFRIGGDEFVVLLQGKGYDTMADVLEAFDRRVEKNVREGGVVVSTGCAVLIQDDRELSDVFERADHMMYERKKQLKEMGAPTR